MPVKRSSPEAVLWSCLVSQWSFEKIGMTSVELKIYLGSSRMSMSSTDSAPLTPRHRFGLELTNSNLESHTFFDPYLYEHSA